uniref:LOB domain-containing protein n=1 Tax=Aegilops tauschii subsp. strangulata TaxID=200361 RepID=A0A453J0X8_AEGTS
TATTMAGAGVTTTGSPCGACKFLRRRCAAECVFAPYFCAEDGASQFAAIHKVFGASNAAKLLQQVAPGDRSEAAATVTYEAQARLRDPVYGCVAHIFALQQQVVALQAQVAHARTQAQLGAATAMHPLLQQQLQQQAAAPTSAPTARRCTAPRCTAATASRRKAATNPQM